MILDFKNRIRAQQRSTRILYSWY